MIRTLSLTVVFTAAGYAVTVAVMWLAIGYAGVGFEDRLHQLRG